VKPSWQESIPGPLTGVVVAEGRAFVAQTDAHTLHAFDAKDGSRLWQYTAGGRIDSPPTIHGGFVYFGSADGWVYCLHATDGELAWRYRAAPQSSQVVSYGQLESAWPVHGSVLVQDGGDSSSRPVVYAVAGRSSFLDGGLYLYGLNALTGEQLHEQQISHRDPEIGREPQETITGKRGTYMPGALPDIFSTDGSSLFMRHSRFGLNCESLPPDVDHLFSPAGFLDDSWWHRTYWLFGREMLPDYHGWPVAGCVRITGRLLVHDGDCVYGFGRDSYEKAGSHLGLNTGYHLFAADAKLGPPKPPQKAPGDWWRTFPGSRVRNVWSKRLPFYARAMILAGDTLFVAGSCQAVDFASENPERDVWLWAVSARDGVRQAEHKLTASPVFDSFAACSSGLYFTSVDGQVVCYQPEE
jgi:outer membrane protein assembly factor BamB